MTSDARPDNWPPKPSRVGDSSTTNLAHDLKNLLTILSGCVDCLDTQIPHSRTTTGYFTDIRCAIECASQIASELLGIDRRFASDAPVIEINQAIENMRAMLGRFLGPKIELMLSLDATFDKVVIHPLDLERILFNLILNARDAMRDGGRLTIETTTLKRHPGRPKLGEERMRPFVRLTVSDTGRGITPAMKARVFDAFQGASGEGVGLGLIGVAETVDRLNGVLHLENEEGPGTRVHVDLPLAVKG